MELFAQEEFFEKDNSPIENVEITTTILYFSRTELKEFKKKAKKGIERMYGQEYQQKGNLSDYLLTLIRQDYENHNS